MMNLEERYKQTSAKLESDSNAIMQAFINFYGENYKDYIINKLKNSKIIWYDDRKCFDDDNARNHIISTIPDNELEFILTQRNNNTFLQSAYIDEFDILVLPLSYDLTRIIHEVNHKVGSHLISVEPLKQISGISYTTESVDGGVIGFDVNLNETVNQKMTLEILAELQKLGTKVKVSSSWQEQLFPLINLFYDTFKDLLKEANITGNLDELKKILGEENYNKFSQLISMSGFRIRRMIRTGERIDISLDKIAAVENLVLEMKAHYEEIIFNQGYKSL